MSGTGEWKQGYVLVSVSERRYGVVKVDGFSAYMFDHHDVLLGKVVTPPMKWQDAVAEFARLRGPIVAAEQEPGK